MFFTPVMRRTAFAPNLRGVDAHVLPQSHFPIRVEAAHREGLIKYLRSHGTDVGLDFPFPAGLDRRDFPCAEKTSEEVLTLPMGDRIVLDEVRMISKYVLDALSELRDRLA